VGAKAVFGTEQYSVRQGSAGHIKKLYRRYTLHTFRIEAANRGITFQGYRYTPDNAGMTAKTGPPKH
jgi:hypothetical protein